jgi:dihydroorotate dehydrogenase (fumarate)
VRWFVLDRWGDSEGTGTFGWHRFGGEVTGYRSFDGVAIPAAGRAGWFFGTDRWPGGEFFRYRITDLHLVTTAAGDGRAGRSVRLDRGPTRGGGGRAEPSGQDAQHVVAGEDAHRPPEGWHAASGAGSTSKDRVRRSSLNGPKAPEEEAAMADLRTRYLGLELPSPLVASSSPLTGTLEGLGRLEAAGAGAVVLPSLFEEDLAEEAREVDALLATGATGAEARAGHPEQAGYGAGPAAYLSLVERAKARLSIPVIASLNGISRGGWVRNAARLEQAGADALELNVYYVSSSPGLGGSEVEWRYLELVRAVRQAIGIPLAVKLSPYFSSVTNMARQLVEAGANALVLFNRFYQPDLDLDTLEVTPRLALSTSEELRLPLRWIAILYRQLPASLAASTGVHTAADAVKVLMAGADVAMMTSALLRHGPEHLTVVEAGLRDWLDGRGMPSVDLLRGLRSQRSVRDPTAWERANYVTMLASYPDQVHTEAH